MTKSDINNFFFTILKKLLLLKNLKLYNIIYKKFVKFIFVLL